jgi:glycine/D-amino acid oxidase-like deaminating enzyme
VTRQADIVIAGAGIAGIAAAECLKRRFPGRDILLVDRLPPMSLTSANSGELYRDWWLDARMARWIHRSIERMERIAEECGNAVAMNRRGYAFVYTTEEGERRAREAVARFGSFGLGHVRVHDARSARDYVPASPVGIDHVADGVDLLLDRALIRRHFPYVTAEARAIVHARRAGWLDAHGYGMRLLEVARGRGVRTLRAELIDVSVDGDGVNEVVVRGDGGVQRIETRCLVNAAGPFLSDAARLVGLDLPVSTVLHQLVVMPDPRGAIPRTAPYTILMEPQQLDWSPEEHAWLRENRLERLAETVPGALHVRPDGPLDSTWIRLGWPYHDAPEAPRWAPDFPPEFPDVVVRGSVRLCPGMAAYVDALPRGVSQLGGYYCKTPENLPVIGPTAVPGFWLLGALSGYGLMAACGAAETLAGWIAGRPEADDVYFSLARYEDAEIAASADGAAASGEL